MEGFSLKSREQLIIDIVLKVVAGKMLNKDASIILGISKRTLRRYLKQYRHTGIYFVKHGNFRRYPANKSDFILKKKVLELVREKYFDFNMLHCLEKLKEDGFHVKRETFRKWCHEIGHVKKEKRRRSKPRFNRDRVASEGIMLQFDGSPHQWFGDRKSCLITAIDDASSEVPYGEFFGSETTFACLQVLKQIIIRKGIFKILYVDKAGVYGGIKRSGFSQVQRALAELGIQVIFADSPEAKGRIERLFGTLQDRLIPEMRLNKIRGPQEANSFFNDVFLPHHYNPRFRVLPTNPISCYQKTNPVVDLEKIFCVKEYRTVARDHTISWQGERYMIANQIKYSIHNQKIEIQCFQNRHWRAFFAGQEIKLKKIQIAKRMGPLYK